MVEVVQQQARPENGEQHTRGSAATGAGQQLLTIGPSGVVLQLLDEKNGSDGSTAPSRAGDGAPPIPARLDDEASGRERGLRERHVRFADEGEGSRTGEGAPQEAKADIDMLSVGESSEGSNYSTVDDHGSEAGRHHDDVRVSVDLKALGQPILSSPEIADKMVGQLEAAAATTAAREEAGAGLGSVDPLKAALEAETQRRDLEGSLVMQLRAQKTAAELEALKEAERCKKKASKRRERMQRKKARRSDQLAAGGRDTPTKDTVVDGSRAAANSEVAKIYTWADADTVPLQVSRARRRAEKRVRKAKAKEKRDRLAWQRKQHQAYPSGSFFGLDEHRRTGGHARVLRKEEADGVGHELPSAVSEWSKLAKRRKPVKTYAYKSGSTYESPGTTVDQDSGKVVKVGKLRAVQAPAMDLLPTVMLKIHEQWRHVKLDTGAQYSVAGKPWQTFGKKLSIPAPVDYMEGFSGSAVRVLGVWRFEFESAYQQAVTVDALVVDFDTVDFLVGEDWMYDQGVKIDFTSGEMRWYADGGKLVLPFVGVGTREQRGARAAKVRLLRKVKIHAQTVHNVEVVVPAADGTVGLLMPRARKQSHLLVAPTVVTVRNGKAIVPVLNLVGRTSRLPGKEKLGTWIPAEGEMDILEMDGELDRERVETWLKTLRTSVTSLSNEQELVIGDMEIEDKELMLALLRKYPSLLEPKVGCPPATTLRVVHHINTGSEPPIKVRPRRHSRSEHETIDTEVKTMLHDGVIEEGTGAWGFPVVLVRKKDGTVRFCIDYRMLNAVTKKDIYPLPRIDEALESMHGARRFTSLDLHAGYWQVPVAEEDKDKTGFVTRQGLFRFVRMPFGLANAPGTFQRMMDAVLRGLAWRSCLVYLDDVIIFTGGTVSRHVVELAVVMERLAEAGLSLKPKKCSFGMQKLEYLGHELDADGIRPLESLVDSVRRFPAPRDPAEVRRFVHLAGYYRRFVPNFGTKAAPMTRLLRRSTEWTWGPEQQEAFDLLKEELTRKPLLIYPDFSKPFKLVTDASVVGLGAALMQDHGNGDQPVAFASKVNSPTVARYGITDLECAAVVWAVRLFRPYLYGRRFELVTDHSALTWLMKTKDLSGRLHRWALQLQEYNFDIKYRAGSTNVVADALSRAPVCTVVARGQRTTATAVGQEVAETAVSVGQPTGVHGTRSAEVVLTAATTTVESGQMTDAEIMQHQTSDKLVQKIRESGRYKGQPIVVRNELVYIRGDDGTRRVVVPAALRAKVLREAHDSIYSGHLRTPQTFARVAQNYWWPDMRAQVRLWVHSCRDCGTRKTQPTAVIPPLRSQGVGAVGDKWAVDVAGPLPVTPDGNRYVIAAVDYASRYAVAVATSAHTAKDIVKFLAERVVLVYGPMRELVMDGAPELNGKVVIELAKMLQTEQTTPVPYRPMLLGLVERFHKVWKDMVSMYVNEGQNDWDRWVPCAAYAYNGARHGTTGFSPNELMMGRRLRAPNELLREDRVAQARPWTEYHRNLVRHLAKASVLAKAALQRDQRRRERYYNQRVRECVQFHVGDLVWILKPPRGKGVTKLAHQWVGPARIDRDAGFDNWRVTRLDTKEELLVHCGFLLSYHYPPGQKETVADRILGDLAADEDDTDEDMADEGLGTIGGEDADTESEIAVGSDGIRTGVTARLLKDVVDGSQEQGVPVSTTTEIAGTEEPELEDVTTETPGIVMTRNTAAPAREAAQAQSGSTEEKSPAPEEPAQAGSTGDHAARRLPGQTHKRKAPSGTGAGQQEDALRRAGKRRADSEARAARAARRDAARGSQAAAESEEDAADADSRVPGATGADEDRTASIGGGGYGLTGITAEQHRGQGQHRMQATRGTREPQQLGPEEAGVTGHGGPDTGGVAGALRGRGPVTWEPPMHHLLYTSEEGAVIERARRRVRNKAGRYELQYQVEYGASRGGPTTTEWISAGEFEKLFDRGKIGDDLLSGDGVWTEGALST